MLSKLFANARKKERELILKTMQAVALENEIGSYCYIQDVLEYLEDSYVDN